MKEREEQAPHIFAFVDIETTGSKSFSDRIIDIGVIRVENGVVTKVFETLLNPHMSIAPFASEVSGISDEDVANAPDFADIALELEELLKDAVFVAHNAHFDYGFIKNEFRRIGMKFSAPRLCTVKLSRALFPHERNHDLDSLIHRHAIACDRRHRALPDALVMKQWFDLVAGEKRDEAIQKQLLASNLTPLLNRSVLKDLPDCPGIYFFYGIDHELLYVGKSKNIRTRVRSHFSSKEEERLCRQTVRVEYIQTPGELSALLLESETIKNQKPLYNRALRRAKKLIVAIQVYVDGYATLMLAPTETIIPTTDIVAIFRSMTQARTKIRELARTYKLCSKLLGIESGIGACFGSQLGTCMGACMKKEEPHLYNKRYIEAFNGRMIKSWPYNGPIMIEEKIDAESGTVFFIDEWRLVKAVKYDHGAEETILTESQFDYDTYKILARYILNKTNRRSITVLLRQELDRTVQIQEDDIVIEYV